ncbi:SH3 domain-containing protein [Pyxidicoccus xibeiensis]|uniref:hypothetical protein n=1 Tax=Pyxidicoccus xibeiensis TaxID=2906759 RepID=UPI0020A72BF3|nr:hypothetical protein [Pyxidicoccus xibeiensis]MCP3138153.1 hypothetical protein [Pyxidicoccus xibeiensis]
MLKLLPLLAAVVFQAASGDTLFVQASALNLRSKPRASAAIRTQVPIGTACSVVSLAKDGWAELTCLQTTGFTKLELLGPTAPDHAQLLAQGTEAGRPTADALNLLQRAVTLKPTDGPTRDAFRELFWKAEFERLGRARAAKDTLKTAAPWSFPEGCADTVACVTGMVAPDAGPVWQEARTQGSDVVLVQLFADGLLFLRSGAVDAGARTVTMQLESLMVPGAAVVEALGAKDFQDACQPVDTFGSGSCGVEYAQSCSPSDCWEPYQDCRVESGKACHECKLACKGTCGDCRMKCGSRGNRKECVASCIQATRDCEAECQAPVDAEDSACERQYDRCSEESNREWARTCEAPCDRAVACVKSCMDRGTNMYECLDRCDNRLPDSCHHKCLSGYQ